jgi:hypothetical protein
LWEQMLRTYFGVFKSVYYVNQTTEIWSLPCWQEVDQSPHH